MKKLILAALLSTSALGKTVCIQNVELAEQACYKEVYGSYYATEDALEKIYSWSEVIVNDISIIEVSAEDYELIGVTLEKAKGNNVGSGNGSNNGSGNASGNTIIIALPGSKVIIGKEKKPGKISKPQDGKD